MIVRPQLWEVLVLYPSYTPTYDARDVPPSRFKARAPPSSSACWVSRHICSTNPLTLVVWHVLVWGEQWTTQKIDASTKFRAPPEKIEKTNTTIWLPEFAQDGPGKLKINGIDYRNGSWRNKQSPSENLSLLSLWLYYFYLFRGRYTRFKSCSSYYEIARNNLLQINLSYTNWLSHGGIYVRGNELFVC